MVLFGLLFAMGCSKPLSQYEQVIQELEFSPPRQIKPKPMPIKAIKSNRVPLQIPTKNEVPEITIEKKSDPIKEAIEIMDSRKNF